MSVLDSLISMIVLIGGIVLLLALQLRTSLITTGMKMRRAIPAQWILADFLKLNPSRRKLNQYYLFAEEHVRSLGHRFVGQVDGAVLHWDNAPILDLIIEYKFPMKQLPKKVRKEDVFQAGLYGLALLESGASCYSTKLVNIYCLQDKAKKCFQRKSFKNCWQCSDGKTYVTRFNPRSVLRNLGILDEVWYKGRKPRPASEMSKCRACPYSNARCNYSIV